jgi:DNA-binding FrmR family transcriptional regulator
MDLEENCEIEGCSTDRKAHHPEKIKKNLLMRLNRIEGQVRGIKNMIEKDAYCDDVLNQISAIQSALHSVSRILLEEHMKSCVLDRLREGDISVIDELSQTMKKMMK